MTSTVLIIESNPGVMIVARNALTGVGIDVVTAANLDEGLCRATTSEATVVVIDGLLVEPGCVREVSDAIGMADEPVPVVLTVPRGMGTSLLDTLRSETLRPGVNVVGVLEKPFTTDELLERVVRHITVAQPRMPSFVPDPVLETDQDQDTVHRTGENDTLDVDLNCDVIEILDLAEGELAILRGALMERDPDDRVALSLRTRLLAARIAEGLASEAGGLGRRAIEALERACRTAIESDLETFLPPPLGGECILSGCIDQVPVGHALGLTRRARAPLRMRIEQADRWIELYYGEDNLFYARHYGAGDDFRLGQCLVDVGALSDKELDRFLRLRPLPMKPIGQQLVAAEIVSGEALRNALVLRSRELLIEAMGWASGTFQVETRRSLPAEAREVSVALPVADLLREARDRLGEWPTRPSSGARRPWSSPQ